MAARRPFLVPIALVAVLTGCVPLAGGDLSDPRVPAASELAPLFELVHPADLADAWTHSAAELLADADAALHPAPSATRIVASTRDLASQEDRPTTFGGDTALPGLGTVTQEGETQLTIENGTLYGSLKLGMAGPDALPAFDHESTVELPVCLADGEDFVSGPWRAAHTQRSRGADGRITELEVTVSATITATSAGGLTFDATSVHAHIRRTDTLVDGTTVMGQGSVQTSLSAVTPDTWSNRIATAVVERAVEVHTRDGWMREEGWAYLGVAVFSLEVPAAVTRAQSAAEEGEGCGGWAIVPLSEGQPMDVYGVMPRISPVDAAQPGEPAFRLVFTERWPAGIRAVPEQSAEAVIVPAGAECPR